MTRGTKAVTTLALLAAACGGSDDTAATTTTATRPPATTTTVPDRACELAEVIRVRFGDDHGLSYYSEDRQGGKAQFVDDFTVLSRAVEASDDPIIRDIGHALATTLNMESAVAELAVVCEDKP